MNTKSMFYVLLFLPALAYAHGGDPNLVHACLKSNGQTYIVGANTICSGSTDEPLHWASAGPQGPQGPQGLTGATGAKGDAGDQGIQGIQGLKGDAGDQGIQGVKGDAGTNGVNGDTGPQGPVGLTGPQGETGAPGSTGAQGETGLQGLTGATGAKGDAGADGLQGLTGLTGPAGSAGLQGLTGATGLTGPAGATGAAGSAGTYTPPPVTIADFSPPGTGTRTHYTAPLGWMLQSANVRDIRITAAGVGGTVLASISFPEDCDLSANNIRIVNGASLSGSLTVVGTFCPSDSSLDPIEYGGVINVTVYQIGTANAIMFQCMLTSSVTNVCQRLY